MLNLDVKEIIITVIAIVLISLGFAWKYNVEQKAIATNENTKKEIAATSVVDAAVKLQSSNIVTVNTVAATNADVVAISANTERIITDSKKKVAVIKVVYESSPKTSVDLDESKLQTSNARINSLWDIYCSNNVDDTCDVSVEGKENE